MNVSGFDRIMIIAPILLRHKIAEHSPLYSYSKSTFSRHDFEIVVIVEGAVEQTGMTTQMRTSYTPDEILWGHYFKSVTITYSTSLTFAHTHTRRRTRTHILL